MPAIYNQVLIQYRDQNGKEGTSFWPSVDQDAGGASAYVDLAAKVQAITNCAVIGVQFQQSVLITATPTTGPYKTITDRAMMLSKIVSTNKPFMFSVPGPMAAIFEADTLKVNLSNADVLALQAAMMPLIGDNEGNPMGPFRKGYRTEAKGSTS
jgi:hypothetical protein